MNSYDAVRENFNVMLSEILNNKSDINIVLRCFDAALKNYDITTKETAMVVYDGNRIEQLVEFYIKAMKTRSLRDRTLDERRRTLYRFFRIIGKSPTEVCHQDIYTYKYILMEGGCQANTINSYLTGINAFFTWCVKRGFVESNPIEREDKSKVAPTEKMPLSDAEISVLRDAVKDSVFHTAIVEFMLSTGMRREEITKAKKKDILYDRADENGNVPISVPDGKGGKGRFTFISKKAMDAINVYFNSRNDDSDYIFVSKRKEPLSASGLEYIFKCFREWTGIEKLTPHTLRRTFATNSVQNGVAINAVARVMGHSSIDTTMVYAKDTMETLLTQFEKAM